MEKERATIHISVACHKPSRLPKNAIFAPIQVNAATAAKRLEMDHDDEGDNISFKNASYCELTAQYWEWKNVEADYYGLCHYRRFLCFTTPENVKLNNRNQYDAEITDDWNLQRFGLEDEETMRKVIEKYDAVTGNEQDIPRLFTPRGNQTSAYKHWTAHNRDLIMTKDLDRMLEILSEVSPEVGKDTREYLDGKYFTGFNCFVMKKELFRELCEIEFKTLEKLEAETDITHYCTQVSRIYGFMGEIISSGYLYHLKKRGLKVKHVPLVFFKNTDEEVPIRPLNEAAIPIVFYHTIDKPELFAVTWQSFLSNQNPEQQYEATICNVGMQKPLQDTLKKMAAEYENITVRFADGNLFFNRIAERYTARGITLKGEKVNGTIPVLPFLLDSLTGYREIILFGNRTLIRTAPDNLWAEKIEADKVFAAPLDPYMLSRINDTYPETEYNHIKIEVKDVWQYYSTTAMKIDLQKYKTKLNCEQLLDICMADGKFRVDAEILNICFQGLFQTIDLRWCVWYESCDYLHYQLPYAPKAIYQELLKARKDPFVISFLKNDPFEGTCTELTEPYWTEARKTPCYEVFIHQINLVHYKKVNAPKKVSKKIFKRGTKAYAFMSRSFPKDSKRYAFCKKALSLFHAE